MKIFQMKKFSTRMQFTKHDYQIKKIAIILLEDNIQTQSILQTLRKKYGIELDRIRVRIMKMTNGMLHIWNT